MYDGTYTANVHTYSLYIHTQEGKDHTPSCREIHFEKIRITLEFYGIFNPYLVPRVIICCFARSRGRHVWGAKLQNKRRGICCSFGCLEQQESVSFKMMNYC